MEVGWISAVEFIRERYPPGGVSIGLQEMCMYLGRWNPREWKSDDDLEKPEEVERREKKALWRGKRRVAIQHVSKTGIGK
jgi:hypothetical protein